MKPATVGDLTEEIKRTERRRDNVYLSKTDYEALLAYLAELHAARWYLIMDKQRRAA